jgi:hypothetical protein
MDTLIIDPILKDPIHAEAKQKQEYKFIGSKKIHPGQILWQYNYETDQLSPVNVTKDVMITSDKKITKKQRANYNPKCWYFGAINRKNAEKVVNRTIAEIIEKFKN